MTEKFIPTVTIKKGIRPERMPFLLIRLLYLSAG